MYLAKPFGFLLAYTLGNISPKIRTIDVMIPTSSKKRNQGWEMVSKNSEEREAKTRTVAIFIRLFSSKIIANKRLGFLRRCAITRSDL